MPGSITEDFLRNFHYMIIRPSPRETKPLIMKLTTLVDPYLDIITIYLL